ncbi:MAG: thermitase [Acidimicrobiaceae bacterium]|nr:thermitase [Acidimicrobiaceae bacterium]
MINRPRPGARYLHDTGRVGPPRAHQMRRQTLLMAAIVLATSVAGLTNGFVAQAGAATEMHVSVASAGVNDVVGIVGHGLARLQGAYSLTVGGLAAWPTMWTDTEIRFVVPAVDPGPASVSLQPQGPAGSTGVVVAGTLDINKALLPPVGVSPVDGLVKLRLASGTSPASVRIGSDTLASEFANAIDDKLGRWYLVTVPSGAVVERINAYAADTRIEVVEYDAVTSAPARYAQDPVYRSGTQTNVRQVRLTAAWEQRTAGAAIAIVDTGVRPTHEELAGLVVRNRDFTGTGLGPCGDHGTGVAGIAAANTDNGVGIAGASWSTGIGSYKALGGVSCNGTNTALEQAVNAAVADSFGVINMSIQDSQNLVSTQDVMTAAWNHGASLVAAAGNHNTNAANYPGAFAHVFAVASANGDDSRFANASAGSNWGSWVAMAAPGVNVTMPAASGDQSYWTGTGTSMAAPLVAGAVALLRTTMSNAAVDNALRATADPINWGNTPIGGGRLNAYNAIRAGRYCLRDLAQGSFVQFPDNRIVQVTGAATARQVPDMTVLSSWLAANDWVPICQERANELSVASSRWGYRPGRLVRNPANGFIYLITTDGADRGLPTKRLITNTSVFSCFGWSFSNAIDDVGGLALHPAGPDISTCVPAPRTFPNGAVVRSSTTGLIYVIDNGKKRLIPNLDVYNSWFASAEWVAASDAELALIANGVGWGLRQGKLMAEAGSSTVYAVTDDGATRAAGSRRPIADWTTDVERGLNSFVVYSGQPTSVSALHPLGSTLRNADDLA